MAVYRFHILDNDGDRTFHRDFICLDDDEALTLGARLMQGTQQAEVYQNERLLGTVSALHPELVSK